MYTLRRILENGYEYNFFLGDSYTLLRKEHLSEEEWDTTSKSYWGETYSYKKEVAVPKEPVGKMGDVPENPSSQIPERDCYAFILTGKGEYHFILPWQRNYIMTESGKTFSRL